MLVFSVFYWYFHAAWSSKLVNCMPTGPPWPHCTWFSILASLGIVQIPFKRVNQYFLSSLALINSFVCIFSSFFMTNGWKCQGTFKIQSHYSLRIWFFFFRNHFFHFVLSKSFLLCKKKKSFKLQPTNNNNKKKPVREFRLETYLLMPVGQQDWWLQLLNV